MIRKHEITDSIKAGLYALGVHVALLAAMLISFNWKAAHPVMNVTEVELWDKLPVPTNIQEPKPEPKPEPVIKEEPKPETKPEPKPIVKEEPNPEPKPEEPKVDIELEKKKKELELKKVKELEEKVKKEELRKKIAQQMREEDLQNKKAEKQAKIDNDKALQKLKEDMLNETGEADAKATSSANASLIGEYTEKIKAKIRGNVNKTLCGDGNPELTFAISVLPTGQLSGNPKLVKSSGNAACDEAAERAIIASEPLPLPSDPALFSQFRNINLKFRPND
jgi:colicin import membrane protein